MHPDCPGCGDPMSPTRGKWFCVNCAYVESCAEGSCG